MKRLLFLLLFWASTQGLSAQGYFNMGYGLNVGSYSFERALPTVDLRNIPDDLSSLTGYSGSMTNIGFHYAVRYQFLQQNDNFGIGVAGYPFLGVYLNVYDESYYQYNTGNRELATFTRSETGGGFALGLPVYVEAAYGAGATEDSEASIGVFGGAGIDLRYVVGGEFFGKAGPSPLMVGPSLTGGVRFGFTETYLSLGATYTIPVVEYWKQGLEFRLTFHFY